MDEKESEVTSIRMYGLGENQQNICIRIDNFTPYVYIELPSDIKWTEAKAQLISRKIDQIMGTTKPLKKALIHRYKLYGANLQEDGSRRKFPYLFCSFSSKNDINMLCSRLRKDIGTIVGIGTHIKLKVHEQDASPILQLICARNIHSVGWISFKGTAVHEDEKLTICDEEYLVKWKEIMKYETDVIGNPLIMGFDIEVNSSNPSAMPNADKVGDKIFQISCVFTRDNNYEKDDTEPYLLTLGDTDEDLLGSDIKLLKFKTEGELLIGFTQLVLKKNPNVIVGYNILGFDIPYMIQRQEKQGCGKEFTTLGFHAFNAATQRTIKWSSSAYGTQEFEYLDAEGRIFVDLLPLVKRDYKLDNYKLKTVSEYFLKDDTKADLSVSGIFKCYRIGTKKDPDGSYSRKAKKAIALCGKYCVQDSLLVVKLMKKMQTWVGLCEMAKTVNCSIFSLYTQGQQIKVFSQVYKYSTDNNIVVEKDGYQTKDDERYVGAHVFPPVPGIYDSVLPFDFCLSGDTLVTMSNGLSKRLDTLAHDEQVVGYNSGSGFANYSMIHGLQRKGVRETVKVVFEDGTSIIATPDHKFMLDDEQWCEAKDLNGKSVKTGIEYTEDRVCFKEAEWYLSVLGYEFSMKTFEEREKSLAFARILGYVLADGSIYLSNNRKCAEATFGTLIDAENFKRDVMKFSVVDLKITKKTGGENEKRMLKGVTFKLSIPANLSKMIHSLDDITVGKRATQAMKLPAFILDENCPLSIIREFLAGLLGGDGSAPCYTSSDNFTATCFKWTTCQLWVEDMMTVFGYLQSLFLKFNLTTVVYKPQLVKYREGEKTIRPKDYAENARYDIQLTFRKEDCVIFLETVGFRYCINKSYRLSVVSSYQRMMDKTREQHSFVVERTNELISTLIPIPLSRAKANKMTFDKCLEIAQTELLEKEKPINIYSLSSVKDIGYQRGEAKRHSDKPRVLSLQKKKFPTFSEYLKKTESDFAFDFRNYNVKSDDIYFRSVKKSVIDIRPNGMAEVFDIEVNDVHNFVANGVVVHNCSLYPTTIIAYNIDYSTLVTDDAYPDSKCHVMKWEDHLGCEHDPKVIRRLELSKVIELEKAEIKKLRTLRDTKGTVKKLRELRGAENTRKQSLINEINRRTEELKPLIEERSALVKTITKNTMCAIRNYRFVKEPRGVLPTILQNLLDARKNTRTQIKNYMKTINDENRNEITSLVAVLDKRQLAYKISANSMYGAMGVKKGYLPFMPGAMCTTYKGRCNIEIVAKTIPEKYGGQLVYGDTDSNYIHFPHLKTAQEAWDFAELVATEVSELFPKPIKLDFEAVIYARFFILTKKRYMYKSCGRDGVVGEKIGKKGVLLARRDTSVFVRNLYEDIIKMIFNNVTKNDIIYFILQELNKLCSNSLDYKKFVITKSVGSTENLLPTLVKNEKGVECLMMGDYKVPKLPMDAKERAEQLEKKSATTEQEYYEKCLPAQVQLALKMRKRGYPVQSGTRLEFLITDIENHGEKQYEKIEDFDYFKKFSSVLTVDFFYYLKIAINSVDEILNIAFGTEFDFMKEQYNYRYKIRRKVLNDIKALNTPKIKFIN
jgi:DNA polymerase elongation subunit (family B)